MTRLYHTSDLGPGQSAPEQGAPACVLHSFWSALRVANRRARRTRAATCQAENASPLLHGNKRQTRQDSPTSAATTGREGGLLQVLQLGGSGLRVRPRDEIFIKNRTKSLRNPAV